MKIHAGAWCSLVWLQKLLSLSLSEAVQLSTENLFGPKQRVKMGFPTSVAMPMS